MPKITKSEKVVAEVKEVVVEKETKKAKTQKGAAIAEPKVEAKVEPKVEAKVEAVPVVTKVAKVSKKAAAATAVVETPKEEVVESAQEGGKRRVRYFRCMYTDNTFGRFSGYKPKQAAGKALTSILKQRQQEGKDLAEEIGFSMVECTRGGSHKISQYTGKRVKLEKPVTVTIKTSDGKKKEINYNFTNKIAKVKSEKKVAVKKTATKKTAVKKTATKKTAVKKTAKTTKATTKKTSTKVAATKTSTKKADA
jgi:hypothetical protein